VVTVCLSDVREREQCCTGLSFVNPEQKRGGARGWRSNVR